MRLVAEGRQSLVEVAFLTGFADQSSFTRAFRRWSGTTPRKYRETSSRMPASVLGQATLAGQRLRA